ncbi:hypothetical protein PCASD_00013 [Puccinia coronata f. sp. avenae]|uniref:HAT C-terminal dimerisation domain-containing protein n=1 Tax=Puccinia coronata f. sp. avenae TaxID=200324 RepID=A0A2N5VQH7_9BASI|nr:hypothetical protein PCASD_00013 [Puccinia coronata f. sp. avenae]
MTAEANQLITKKAGINPNLCSNHIRCICHKVALILTTGLKSINTGTAGLTKSKKKTLGFVPHLEAIPESNDKQPGTFHLGDEEVSRETEANSDDESSCANNNQPGKLPDNPETTMAKILKKEFYFVTEKMEGDHSLAGMIIVEYQLINNFLKERLRTVVDFELKGMLKTMIKKTKTYLTKALACNAIILATILNPSYQISAELAANMGPRQPSPPAESQPQLNSHWRPIDGMDLFPAVTDSVFADELSSYLGGKYKYIPSQADQCLTWCKEHHGEFPILALLAKDYLACSATSASVERCFLAAADICGRDQGSLSPRMIERSN